MEEGLDIDYKRLQTMTNEISLVDVRAALFRKRNFDFIVRGKNEDGKVVVHEKQRDALKILTSGKYEEFLYGGAAGGAKSWTGCCWIMFMAICYPGTKYFIARNELKDIIDSVLVTFNKVARTYGFEDYKFNAVKNWITLGNGSHINFIEIKYKPSDPMFEDVGSTEYTAGWIEEVGEIHETGAAVIASRVGRHLNGKYKIKGTVFYTCNPKQNWAKTLFYDKDKVGTLEDDKKYLSCLITENPFIEKDYVNKLRKIGEKDKSLYERLFKGNWDYEENPYQLADQEEIDNIFENDHVEMYGKRYITADIARFGSDKAVIMVWEGWVVIDILTFDISKTTDISHAILYFRNKYNIPKIRCLADADGVGGGVVDMSGIKGFVNGARAIRENSKDPNYRNLKVQCQYYLADKINKSEVWINCDLTNKQKADIKVELAQIQSTPSLRDGTKLDCKMKGQIKSDIGRSPDYLDTLMMRSFFDLKKVKRSFLGSKSRSTF